MYRLFSDQLKQFSKLFQICFRPVEFQIIVDQVRPEYLSLLLTVGIVLQMTRISDNEDRKMRYRRKLWEMLVKDVFQPCLY